MDQESVFFLGFQHQHSTQAGRGEIHLPIGCRLGVQPWFTSHQGFRKLLMAALSVVVMLSAEGDDRSPSPLPCFLCDLYSEGPMGWYERELEQAGFKIDNVSLIHSLRGIATPQDRVLIIGLLALREAHEAEGVLLKILDGQVNLPLPETYLRLQDEDPSWGEGDGLYLREEAAIALARLGDDAGLEALRNLVHSSRSLDRQLQLATHLAELGDLSGFRYLATASESEDPRRRLASMNGLGWSAAFNGTVFDGSRIDAIERLNRLGRDEDLKIRREFLMQVALAAYHGVTPEVFRQVMQEIAEEEPDPVIRDRAARELRAGSLSPDPRIQQRYVVRERGGSAGAPEKSEESANEQ